MRNESDENCRLVIEFKRDAIPEGGHQQPLQAHPAGESRFSVNALAIDHGKPEDAQCSRRSSSATSSTAARSCCAAPASSCSKAEERAELLEGYICALNEPRRVHPHHPQFARTAMRPRVKLLAFEWTRAQVERWGILIRSEERLNEGRYALTERQVDAILELRLYQLTGLEIDKVAGRIQASSSNASRTCSTSSPRNRA
jgi:DNA gyrase subunit A